jgi:hypothetical protein
MKTFSRLQGKWQSFVVNLLVLSEAIAASENCAFTQVAPSANLAVESYSVYS